MNAITELKTFAPVLDVRGLCLGIEEKGQATPAGA